VGDFQVARTGGIWRAARARIEKPLEFARRTRVLLLRHVESGIDIDVILSGLPFEAEAVSRAAAHDLGGVRVRLPQVEDLLIMKAIAHRPQDLRDIEPADSAKTTGKGKHGNKKKKGSKH
jgi:hypothetical protein